MNDLSTEQLRALLKVREQIENLKNQEQRIMGGKGSTGRRRLSAATRKKLSLKLKKVWAERKAKKLDK
jgi:hypothetical protein